MQIINQAKVIFEYRKTHTSPIIVENIFSNKVVTYVICHKIKAEKKVNKLKAYTFDILTYDIFIHNSSNECVKNIVFIDLIPKGTQFIFNSVKINEKKERCKNPSKGIFISKLECGQCMKISFDVVIIPNHCIKSVKNYACISYDFVYNIEKKPMRVCTKTNKVCTVKENLFKSISVKSIIDIKGINIIKNDILKIFTSVEVLEVKIINGLKNNKILVLCKINYEIKYKEGMITGNCICSKGFSHVIFVPNGINYYTNEKLLKNIKLCIEGSNYIFLCNNKILINSQILMEICK